MQSNRPDMCREHDSGSEVMRLFISIVLAGIIHSSLATSQEARLQDNRLAFSQGTVLLDYTSQYGNRDSNQWLALGLIDGTPEMGWCSEKGAPFPHQFLFELNRNYVITNFGFDNRKTQERSYPGISAKTVEVHASTVSREGPFDKILSTQIKPSKETYVPLSKPAQARWLKLVIRDNTGNSDYTELMEFIAYGEPTGEAPETQPIGGTYRTNWNDFYLQGNTTSIRGCYDYFEGEFDGNKENHHLNIAWRQTNGEGKAAMAITQDGAHFNGFWYAGGRLKGTWEGERKAQGVEPKCARAFTDEQESPVAAALSETGKAVLYGIYFDYDSARIKPESATTLNQVKIWLQNNKAKRLRFEGHTDSDGAEQYNLDLSQRRAKAVQSWLIEHAVADHRLSAIGHGESKPVASNATAHGKSLNRRVEVFVAQ
jgi:outer membrane protein OmpA-like peptidoglycan-associated protein